MRLPCHLFGCGGTRADPAFCRRCDAYVMDPARWVWCAWRVRLSRVWFRVRGAWRRWSRRCRCDHCGRWLWLVFGHAGTGDTRFCGERCLHEWYPF